MNSGTFTYGTSTWSQAHDPREEFYRQQAEQQALANRIERSALWLQIRLGDEQFQSEEEMRAVVVGLATDLGYKLDDDFSGVLRSAVATLWQTGRYTATNTRAA